MSTFTVGKLREFFNARLNVLIAGHAGTGKTYMVREAAKQLGWKMKYYSTPTLDPFTDLVGIPVPSTETKVIEYYRPRLIDDAEIIFFDELNRGDARTLNAVFEIIQFGTLNGEPLPNLKCVVAAINPNDGDYTVDELDPALLDRFDLYLQSEPVIDLAYFTSLFGSEVALAAKNWWTDYHTNIYESALRNSKNRAIYLSPRRMEKVVSAYLKVPNTSTISYALPPQCPGNVRALQRELDEALARGKSKTIPTKLAGTQLGELLTMDDPSLRSNKSWAASKDILEDPSVDEGSKSLLVDALTRALATSVGVPTLTDKWLFVVERMTPQQQRTLTATWGKTKRDQMEQYMRSIRKGTSPEDDVAPF